MGGVQGQATDIAIHSKEILRMKDEINQILAIHTGQPMEKIEKDSERDFFMNGQQAKDYGLIDEVITKKQILKSG
jgi:ATP-dependent Clp protease protease subunit